MKIIAFPPGGSVSGSAIISAMSGLTNSQKVAMQNNIGLLPQSAGFFPIEITADYVGLVDILGDSPNAVREIAHVYFNGAHRVVGDNPITTDFEFPGTYESGLSVWSTTTEPELWTSGVWTKTALAIPKSGTVGTPDRYGCATPAAVVIGNKMWVVYSGRAAAAGAGQRSACLASSTNGTTFTKHGAIAGTLSVLDDDFEIIHDRRSGRTFLYGTHYAANPRRPRCWFTDDLDLATANWTNAGECFDSSTPTLQLPYSTWLDPNTGVFWMVAGAVGGGDNPVYYSRDGITYAAASKTVPANLHSFLIRNRHGVFAGWATNGSNNVTWNRRANASDTSRIVVPLTNAATASGSMTFAASRPYARRISNINFLAPTAIAASGSAYWDLEIRCRSVSGPTMITNTQAGTGAYQNIPLAGTFTIPAGATLQAFWTKVGAPANLGFLSVEYTEHP